MAAKIYDLNRKQRRSIMKKSTELYEVLKTLAGKVEEKPLQEGEAIRLDIEKIKGRPQYANKQERYRRFVDACTDEILHVEPYEKDGVFSYFFSVKEDPSEVKWLFTIDDIKERNIDEGREQ